jgi:superfamily II DNA or RNA helicase
MKINRRPQLTITQENAILHINKVFSENNNPICALDTGNGKTIVACEFIFNLISGFKNNDFSILIVISASNKITWQNDLSSYNIEPLYIFSKDKKINEEGRKYIFPPRSILVTSYKKLLIDIEKNYYDLSKKFDLIIYDELHSIINSKKNTKTSTLLTRLNGAKKIALTATPAKNIALDYGLIHIFLNENKITNDLECLEKGIEDCIKKKIVYFGNNKTNSRKLIQRYFRVLSLPIKKEVLNSFNNLNNHSRFKSLSFFKSLPNFNNGNNEILCKKLSAVRIILSKIPRKDKVIIFSQYIEVLLNYYDLCKEEKYLAIIITGDEKGREYESKMNYFTSCTESVVLLTTLQKSSEGLNLQCAHTVIILEAWWNPQKIFQAKGRIDRMDQNKNIFVFLLCYNDCREVIIDEEKRIFDTMNEKNAEINKIIKENMNLEPNNYDETRLKIIPQIKYFTNVDTFEKDFSIYLDNVYAQAYKQNKMDYLYITKKNRREKKPKPLNQTRMEITQIIDKYYLSMINNPFGNINPPRNPPVSNELPSDVEDVKNTISQKITTDPQKLYIPDITSIKNRTDLDEIEDV